MKKFVWIIVSVLFVLVTLSAVFYEQKQLVSTVQTNGFAQVKYNSVYLYKTPVESDEISNKYFLLEETYYVKVTEDTNDLFYKVTYCNLTGYVKKSDLSFVAEIPSEPYLVGITLDIGNSPTLLRSEPTGKSDQTILSVINKNTKNINYLGRIAGEESMDSLGNVWYYVDYTDDLNRTTSGYLYAPQTINLSPITKNEESLTAVNLASFTPLDTLLYLNLSTKNIMLVAISLPTLFILYLLVKPSKILKE